MPVASLTVGGMPIAGPIGIDISNQTRDFTRYLLELRTVSRLDLCGQPFRVEVESGGRLFTGLGHTHGMQGRSVILRGAGPCWHADQAVRSRMFEPASHAKVLAAVFEPYSFPRSIEVVGGSAAHLAQIDETDFDFASRVASDAIVADLGESLRIARGPSPATKSTPATFPLAKEPGMSTSPP